MHASTLKSHQRTHTGEKPFKCSKWAQKLTTAGSLKTRERNHKNDKPFACTNFDEDFKQVNHKDTWKNSYE